MSAFGRGVAATYSTWGERYFFDFVLIKVLGDKLDDKGDKVSINS